MGGVKYVSGWLLWKSHILLNYYNIAADSSLLPVQFSSVQFSRSVVSDSLWPHELQHAGFPVHHQLPEFTQTHARLVGDATWPSHPVVPFSSCPQSLPIQPNIKATLNYVMQRKGRKGNGPVFNIFLALSPLLPVPLSFWLLKGQVYGATLEEDKQ